jgi:hypothetical protein
MNDIKKEIEALWYTLPEEEPSIYLLRKVLESIKDDTEINADAINAYLAKEEKKKQTCWTCGRTTPGYGVGEFTCNLGHMSPEYCGGMWQSSEDARAEKRLATKNAIKSLAAHTSKSLMGKIEEETR